jgi:hypothetical protein
VIGCVGWVGRVIEWADWERVYTFIRESKRKSLCVRERETREEERKSRTCSISMRKSEKLGTWGGGWGWAGGG